MTCSRRHRPRGAVAAIELLRADLAGSPTERSRPGDPITVHEAMAAEPDLAYCPLAYGYASYARPAPGRHALRWADAPRSLARGPPGQRSSAGPAWRFRPCPEFPGLEFPDQENTDP